MKKIEQVNEGFIQPKRAKDHFFRNYFNLAANEGADSSLSNLCTIMSKDYLAQGLTFCASLHRHSTRFRLWVLCVDDTAYNMLEKLQLPGVNLLSLENVRTKKLARIEKDRTTQEFCWTLKAVFISFLLKNNYNIDSLLYLDADIFFFKDVAEIYSEWGSDSVYLTELRLSPKWERRLGKYSAGLVGFKRDNTGRKALRLWQSQCLQWCYDRQEQGLWGDQKYLNEWPQLFGTVKVSANRGINAGSWQIKKGFTAEKSGDAVCLGSQELVCFHFSGFKVTGEKEFIDCAWIKKASLPESIYSPYREQIKEAILLLKTVGHKFS